MSTTRFRTALRLVTVAGLVASQVAVPNWLVAQVAQNPGEGAPKSPAADSRNTSTASGFVNSASGSVYIRRSNGQETLAKVGEVFGPGTTFRTGPESSAVLLFADGQSVALGNESVLRIEEYRFDARDLKASKATLGLMSGIMRLVTGAIHTDNRDALLISAGSASIGILSKDVTAFVVEVDQKSIGVGAAAVTVGEIVVQGPVGAVATVSAEQYTRWQSGAPPAPPAPIASAPAVFQAIVAASRATITGSSAPIDVAMAALQAELGDLPATGAGAAEQNVQAQAADPGIVQVVSAVTPGGGRGCVGSPC